MFTPAKASREGFLKATIKKCCLNQMWVHLRIVVIFPLPTKAQHLHVFPVLQRYLAFPLYQTNKSCTNFNPKASMAHWTTKNASSFGMLIESPHASPIVSCQPYKIINHEKIIFYFMKMKPKNTIKHANYNKLNSMAAPSISHLKLKKGLEKETLKPCCIFSFLYLPFHLLIVMESRHKACWMENIKHHTVIDDWLTTFWFCSLRIIWLSSNINGNTMRQ